MSSEIARRLRLLREARGLSMKEVAQRAAVPESSYREWEYGRGITGEPYMALAKALGVSVQELLTGEKSSLQSLSEEIAAVERQLAEIRSKMFRLSA